MVVLALIACGPPDLDGAAWVLGGALPGSAQQDAECRPAVSVAVPDLEWLQPCDADALPTSIRSVATSDPGRRVYSVSGGGADAIWRVTDDEEEADLCDLAVFPADADLDRLWTIDALGVVPCWRAEGSSDEW